MKIWSLIRVNDIHIGTNKKFTLLFHNTKNTKVFDFLSWNAMNLKNVDIHKIFIFS